MNQKGGILVLKLVEDSSSLVQTRMSIVLFLLLYLVHVFGTGICEQLEDCHSKTINVESPGMLQRCLCGDGSALIGNNTILFLSSNINHYIEHGPVCIIGNMHNLTITSDHHEYPAYISCTTDRSLNGRAFGFFNISGLTMHNLYFKNCGGLIYSTETSAINDSRIYFQHNETAALLISLCKNLTMKSVSFIGEYTGYALIASNLRGNVYFDSIYISKSIAFSNMFKRSSGAVLLYTGKYCDTKNTSVVIRNTTFINNENELNWRLNPIELLENGKDRVPLFGGAGLTLLYIESSPENVLIENDQFINNTGSLGGGCLVFSVNTKLSNLVISYSKFLSNYLKGNTGKGSGIGLYIIASEPGGLNTMVHNDYFAYNVNNHIGAGIYLKLTNHFGYTVNVSIERCTFYENLAKFKGSAIYVERVNYDSKIISQIHAVFTDLYLVSNGRTVKGFKEKFSFHLSVIELVGLKALIKGEQRFIAERNWQKTIVLVRTDLFIAGNVSFIHSRVGSIIELYDLSTITLLSHSHVVFRTGWFFSTIFGSMISAADGILGYRKCPIQFGNESKVSILFNATNDFSNLLKYLIIGQLNVCDLNVLSQYIYTSLNNTIQHFYSSAIDICFCNNNGSCLKYITVETFPGAKISLSVRPICYNKSSCSVTTYITIKQIKKRLILNGSNTFSLLYNPQKHGCTQDIQLTVLCEWNLIIKENLIFFVYDENQDVFSKMIPIKVKTCPIGFSLINGACICNPFLKAQNKFSCDIDSTSITIPKKTWLGFISFDKNEFVGFSLVCPPGYCKDGVSVVNVMEQDSICEPNRIGVLCGGCNKGFSVVLGPDVCSSCNSNLWLLVIAVFTMLGIILVLCLFYLQLTISTELLGGIIFYANMVWVSFGFILPISSEYNYILKIAFSLLNLELGFDLCFYKGMTVSIKTGLQFLFPIYLWLLVLIMSLISRFSNKFANLTVNYSVQVLSTLLYLSFSKLLLTIIDIFIPASVYTPNGTLTVWYVDGNVSYWNDTGHLILLIISFMLSVLYIIPFLIWGLLASYLSGKSKWIRKRRNFVDVFHGQYREGWGWWFGARLFVLLMCSISYTIFRGKNISLLLLVNISILAPFVFTQIYFHPFRMKWASFIDSVILLNLLVASFTFLYSVDHSDAAYAQYAVSVLLSLIVVFSFLFLCVKFLCKFKYGKNLVEGAQVVFLRKLHQKESFIDEDNNYINEFREPLINNYKE